MRIVPNPTICVLRREHLGRHRGIGKREEATRDMCLWIEGAKDVGNQQKLRNIKQLHM